MPKRNLSTPVGKTDGRAELQFRIQQLRMDKIIYAVDAIAVCFLAFLLLISLPLVYSFIPNLPPQTPVIVLGVAALSVVFAISGNIGRLRTIRRLEKELQPSREAGRSVFG